MNLDDVDALRRVVEDQSVPPKERLTAVKAISRFDTRAAEDALLAVACSDAGETELLQAAGEALGQIYFRQHRLGDAPLADFSGPAYLAFDDAVAKLQKGE